MEKPSAYGGALGQAQGAGWNLGWIAAGATQRMDRGVEVGQAGHHPAAELLRAVGEGPIPHDALAVPDADRGDGVRLLQAVAAEHDAGFA